MATCGPIVDVRPLKQTRCAVGTGEVEANDKIQAKSISKLFSSIVFKADDDSQYQNISKKDHEKLVKGSIREGFSWLLCNNYIFLCEHYFFCHNE